MLRAFEAPHSRQARLEINREPLQNPAWLVQIRKEQRIPAEDRLAERPDSTRAIEMENVRKLVGDHECVPVIVVTETGSIRGRVRIDDDSIRWEWRRVAIHEVDVVRDDEIDNAARRDELRRQLSVRTLGVDGGPARLFFDRSGKMHAEMLCTQRAPMLVGRELCPRGPRR